MTITSEPTAAVPTLDQAPVGLRERKKAARRGALVAAALRLVDRDGLDGATVEAICAEAGVSTRTFFNYFESKDDAVLGLEPLTIDAGVAEAFADGGPTGRLMPDLEVLIASLVARHSQVLAHQTCALELIKREPRLIIRKMAWMEQFRASLESLIERRLGPDAHADRVELIAILVLVVTRTVYTRQETERDGPARTDASAVVGELRALLAET